MTCKVKISFQDVQAQRNVRAIQQVINEKCAIKCTKDLVSYKNCRTFATDMRVWARTRRHRQRMRTPFRGLAA